VLAHTVWQSSMSAPSLCREELTVMGMHKAGADSILWPQREAGVGGRDT